MLHGRNLKIYKNGQVIACSRSCEIDTSSDLKEIASPSSGKAKTYIQGRYSWQLSVSGLVATSASLADSLQLVNGDKVFLMFTADDVTFMGGCAFCTKVKVTGTIGNLVQFSASFQGSGILIYGIKMFAGFDNPIRLTTTLVRADIAPSQVLAYAGGNCFWVSAADRTTYLISETKRWMSSLDGCSYSDYNTTSYKYKDGYYYCIADGKLYKAEDSTLTEVTL